jgi:hypothetical protein
MVRSNRRYLYARAVASLLDSSGSLDARASGVKRYVSARAARTPEYWTDVVGRITSWSRGFVMILTSGSPAPAWRLPMTTRKKLGLA